MTAPDHADIVREALDGCTYHGKGWYLDCVECADRRGVIAALDALVDDKHHAGTMAAEWQEQAIRFATKLEATEARVALLEAALRGIQNWPYAVMSNAEAEMRGVKEFARAALAAGEEGT